jgi:hypothetical protein
LFPNYPDEAQIARFLETLGRAITFWQVVETELYEVYEAAIGPQRPGATASGFHAIQTFNIKLAATDAAVRFCLAEKTDLHAEWEKIRRSAVNKSMRRNQLVHFSTFIMVDAKNENERIRLEPQLHDYRHKESDAPRFRVTEIAKFAERFVDLASQLRTFKRRLSAALDGK